MSLAQRRGCSPRVLSSHTGEAVQVLLHFVRAACLPGVEATVAQHFQHRRRERVVKTILQHLRPELRTTPYADLSNVSSAAVDPMDGLAESASAASIPGLPPPALHFGAVPLVHAQSHSGVQSPPPSGAAALVHLLVQCVSDVAAQSSAATPVRGDPVSPRPHAPDDPLTRLSVPGSPRTAGPVPRQLSEESSVSGMGSPMPTLGNRYDSCMSLLSRKEPATTRLAQVSSQQFDGTSVVNQYLLLHPLGQGSQGQVLLAMDTTNSDEMRAVKVLPREAFVAGAGRHHALQQRRREMVEHEVGALKRCRHRNIVALYEVIDDPEAQHMYLVMQYVEYGPVVRMASDGTSSKTIAPSRLICYARQLLAGLHYLHNHGVVHRDIKPDNILLGTDDVVYLADFGVSELFDEAAAPEVGGFRSAGTAAFMAPELLGALPPTTQDGLHRCDVWALGASLYAMLFGRLPWAVSSRSELMAALAGDDPVELPALTPDGAAVGPGWRAVLQGMLHRDPRQRFTVAAARAAVKREESLCDAAAALQPAFTPLRPQAPIGRPPLGRPRPFTMLRADRRSPQSDDDSDDVVERQGTTAYPPSTHRGSSATQAPETAQHSSTTASCRRESSGDFAAHLRRRTGSDLSTRPGGSVASTAAFAPASRAPTDTADLDPLAVIGLEALLDSDHDHDHQHEPEPSRPEASRSSRALTPS